MNADDLARRALARVHLPAAENAYFDALSRWLDGFWRDAFDRHDFYSQQVESLLTTLDASTADELRAIWPVISEAVQARYGYAPQAERDRLADALDDLIFQQIESTDRAIERLFDLYYDDDRDQYFRQAAEPYFELLARDNPG